MQKCLITHCNYIFLERMKHNPNSVSINDIQKKNSSLFFCVCGWHFDYFHLSYFSVYNFPCVRWSTFVFLKLRHHFYVDRVCLILQTMKHKVIFIISHVFRDIHLFLKPRHNFNVERVRLTLYVMKNNVILLITL